jgi:hypothetical protein
MSTVYELFRSASGYTSPYFVVDSTGNLITQTITITGSRLELTPGSYVSSSGELLLSQTTLGTSVVNILGTLTGLSVAGTVNLAGVGNVTLSPTGTVTLSPTGAVTMNPSVTGNINNINIGATTSATGRFSTLSVTASAAINPSGAVTISPTGAVTISPASAVTVGTAGVATNLTGHVSAVTANQTITFSPTGTGTVTVNPGTTGAIDNVAIGATTSATGRFTSASATAPDEKWNSNPAQLATKRYVENSIMFSYFTGR